VLTRQIKTTSPLNATLLYLSWVLVGSFVLTSGLNASDLADSKKSVAASPEVLSHDFPRTSTVTSAESARHFRALASAAFSEGQRLALTGNFEQALTRYQEAAQADPTYSATYAQIALTLLRLDREDEALHTLTEQLKQQPTDSQLHALLAYCLINQKDSPNKELALAHATRSLELDPTLISNYRILAQGLQLKNKPAGLKELLAKALKTPSNEAAFHLRMASLWNGILLESNTKPSSINSLILPFYEKAYQVDPLNPDTSFHLGQVHFDSGNYPQALNYYQIAYALNRKIPGLRERLALSYLSSNQENEAIPILENLLEEFPDRSNLYSTVGELYERAGKWSEAATYYAAYLKFKTPNAEDYIRLAQAQMMLIKPKEALTTLESAVADFPTLTTLQLLKAVALCSLQRPADAINVLKDVETTAQGNPQILNAPFYFQYGTTLAAAGRTEESEEFLKKCLTLNPHYHQALNYLGFSWAEQNRQLSEAEAYVIKALALDPENSSYQDSLGWIYHKQGRQEQARAILLSALQKTPDSPELLEHLGHVYLKLGQTKEALTAWQRALPLSLNQEKLQALIKETSTQEFKANR